MKNVNIFRKVYNRIAQRLGKDDLVYLGAGAMCDMAWVVDGEISSDDAKNGYIHRVGGSYIFNQDKFDAHYRKYSNEGARFKRTALCVGGERKRSEVFMPWIYVSAKDAFDLSQFDERWFVIFRQMVVRWNFHGITPIVIIKNECDERKADRRAQSPYFHNVNGGKELYDAVAIKYDKVFVDKLVALLQGLDFYVELVNEGHKRRGGAVEWCRAIIPILYKHGIEPWRIMLGADVMDYEFTGIGGPKDRWTQRWIEFDGLENSDLIMHDLVQEYEREKKFMNVTHEAFYISHSFGERPNERIPEQTPFGQRTQYTMEAWGVRNLGSNRVVIDTDGTDHADDPGGRPSPRRMKAAMLYCMRMNPRYKKSPMISGRPKFLFYFLPNRQGADAVALEVRAMAEAVHEFFGVWPRNRGKYPPLNPAPAPPAKPEITLKATRSSIVKGESAVLVWAAKNADQVKLDQVDVALAGKATVMPIQTATFTVTATGPGGFATAAVMIEVTEPAPEPVPGPKPEPKPEPSAPAAPWYSWKRIRNVRRWTWQAWLALAAIVVLCVLIF